MKKIFIFFFICFVFAVLTQMDEKFFKSDIFRIKDISIQGDVDLLRPELEQQANHLNNKLIWYVDTQALEELLETDVRIEEAEVKKEIPNKLTIKIKSKRPRYYIQYQGNIYSLDGDSNAFSYLRESPNKDFPIMVVENDDDIERLIRILKIIEGKDVERLISQLYIESDNCINLVLLDGSVIKTIENVDPEKYTLVERLYLKLKSDNRDIEYIDIRFDDYVVK